MSRKLRHIKSLYNIIKYEESNAYKKPTITAFISKETVETNAETKSVRQKGKFIPIESKLVEDTKTKRQEKKTCFVSIMENEAIGFA
tara:strand:+ start:3247 stop:3507 length:261 start_codon:yes stop_codon:yes gene_type:complete